MFELLNKAIVRILSIVVLGAMLASCAAGKYVKSANDLTDDGKRNSLMMSYDVRLDAHDRYPGVQSTQLALRCGPTSSVNRYPVCFYLTIPFSGKREEQGYVVNSFERSGSILFQIKYGDYHLARASHSVVVGKRRERICYPIREHKHDLDSLHPHRHLRCHDEYHNIANNFLATLPENSPEFTVSAGDGCYLGHLTLHMHASRVVKFEFSSSLNPEVFEKLPVNVREAARARIKQECVGSVERDLST